MNIKNLILLISFIIIRSQAISPQSKTGDFPVIDISKQYPSKKIDLQGIADIEYIPLETTDEILLSDKAVLSYVSDKYILIHEPLLGDIFVFNRTGGIYTYFNNKGQSGQEYLRISAGVIFDEENEEIFVCSQHIQVYSLNGEYKRTLKKNTLPDGTKVFDFNDEALFVYDDVIIDPRFEGNTKKKPYTFISKKDGNVISVLDIHFPIRYSTHIAKIEKNSWRPIGFYLSGGSMYDGQDFMIADMSSDTLYRLTQNKELTPILIRHPSVHASKEQRKVWTTLMTTDKFILIGVLTLDFNNSKRGGRIPILMYKFETGEISEISFSDSENDRGKWGPSKSPAIAKNMTAELIQAPEIINAYKKKLLKGDFAAVLDEDDNPVVRIIKFK